MNGDAKKYVPYSVIAAAKHGDIEAIEEILDFYNPIIRSMARVTRNGSSGNSYTVVDEDLCRELEIKLIISIMNFEIRED